MNSVLLEVFDSRSFTRADGSTIKVHSETSKDQCKFLQQIIKQNGFNRSLEIGFAYGTSTCAITESVADNNGQHTVIDKFQNSSWDGVGLELIEKAGLHDSLIFYDDFCYERLPLLLGEEAEYDFVYIDSTKQLDWLMMNFFYIDRLLTTNGIVVFDDVATPSIRKLLRYISKYPSYDIACSYPGNQKNRFLLRILSKLRYLPKAKRLFRPELIQTDYELGINASCVALKKISEDNRKWNWYFDF